MGAPQETNTDSHIYTSLTTIYLGKCGILITKQ